MMEAAAVIVAVGGITAVWILNRGNARGQIGGIVALGAGCALTAVLGRCAIYFPNTSSLILTIVAVAAACGILGTVLPAVVWNTGKPAAVRTRMRPMGDMKACGNVERQAAAPLVQVNKKYPLSGMAAMEKQRSGIKKQEEAVSWKEAETQTKVQEPDAELRFCEIHSRTFPERQESAVPVTQVKEATEENMPPKEAEDTAGETKQESKPQSDTILKKEADAMEMIAAEPEPETPPTDETKQTILEAKHKAIDGLKKLVADRDYEKALRQVFAILNAGYLLLPEEKIQLKAALMLLKEKVR